MSEIGDGDWERGTKREGDIDLGDGHYLRFVSYGDDKRTGANVFHKKKDGTDCSGWIPFEGGEWAAQFPDGLNNAWKVVEWEPLTLQPSLACRVCGDHGHVTKGKWVRAG